MVFGRTTEPRFDPLVAVGAEQGGLAPWRDARDLWKQVKAWPVGGAACTRHDTLSESQIQPVSKVGIPPPPFAIDTTQDESAARAPADARTTSIPYSGDIWDTPEVGEETSERLKLRPSPEAMARLHEGRHEDRAKWIERGYRNEGRYDRRLGDGANVNGVVDGLHSGRWQGRIFPNKVAGRAAEPPREPPPTPPGARVMPPPPEWVAKMHDGRWQARAGAKPADPLASDRRAGAFESQAADASEHRAPWIKQREGSPRKDSAQRLVVDGARAEDVVSRVARQRAAAQERRRRRGLDENERALRVATAAIDPTTHARSIDAVLVAEHRRNHFRAFM